MDETWCLEMARGAALLDRSATCERSTRMLLSPSCADSAHTWVYHHASTAWRPKLLRCTGKADFTFFLVRVGTGSPSWPPRSKEGFFYGKKNAHATPIKVQTPCPQSKQGVS